MLKIIENIACASYDIYDGDMFIFSIDCFHVNLDPNFIQQIRYQLLAVEIGNCIKFIHNDDIYIKVTANIFEHLKKPKTTFKIGPFYDLEQANKTLSRYKCIDPRKKPEQYVIDLGPYKKDESYEIKKIQDIEVQIKEPEEYFTFSKNKKIFSIINNIDAKEKNNE